MAPPTPVNLWLDCLTAESNGSIQFDDSKGFYSVKIDEITKGMADAHGDDPKTSLPAKIVSSMM